MVAELSAHHKGGRLRISRTTSGSRRQQNTTRKSRPDPLSPGLTVGQSGRTACLTHGARVTLPWSRHAGFDPLSPSVESRARRGPARTRHGVLRSLPPSTTRMTSCRVATTSARAKVVRPRGGTESRAWVHTGALTGIRRPHIGVRATRLPLHSYDGRSLAWS